MTATSAAGASLKKILAGRPTFIIHRSHQYRTRVPEVVEALADKHGSNLGLGVAANMAKLNSKALSDHFRSYPDVPLKIADPQLYHQPNVGWDGHPTQRDGTPDPLNSSWDYFTGIPKKPEHDWVSRVLQAQKEVGATVLLSASGWVDSAQAKDKLHTGMDFVRMSRSIVDRTPMFVNLTMDYRWLTEPALRSMLLTEMTESPEKLWYLRFWWPIVPVRYGQLADVDLLRGYRILTRHAAAEGKRLFLPNTGLTGWVMSALGATGFSTGSAWPEQAFARQRKIAMPAGRTPPPRIQRVFDRHVLHTLELDDFERLRDLDGHRAHSTKFVEELVTDGHHAELAGLHYLNAVGNLQARLSAGNPSVTAMKAVKRATEFVDGLDRLDKLAGANNPTHLPHWAELLR